MFLSAILQLRRLLSTTVEPTAGSVCTPSEEGPGQKGVVGDSVAGSGAPCPATGEEAGVENGVGSWSWDPAVGVVGVEKGGCTGVGVGGAR